MKPSDNTNSIVLYDGVCHLCDSCVRFVLKHEKTSEIRFCHLQSNTAKKLLTPFAEPIKLDTIYFIENEKLYERSTAALKIARHLNPPWSWTSVFLLIPKVLRDAVYKYVGKHRYRWFGHSDICILPDDKDAPRFLE